MTETGIGASIPRKEDYRFITGTGRYVDDINLRGQAHACFVRSPHAHAEINSINTDKAKGAAGVVAVFTGEDLTAGGLGPQPCGWSVSSKNGDPHVAPPFPLMADGRVRYVGENVALVVADTLAEAKSAAELVEVDYKPLPAVTSASAALNAGVQLHDEAPGNLSFDWELGDKAAADEAIANASHVTKIEIVNNRVVPNAMEPRAAVADYNQGTQELTLYTTSQNPHLARLVLTAFLQLAPEHKLRVVAPDVGGGFGSKVFIYADETAVAWAARATGRPIKWTAERSESFLTDRHGRDHVTMAELALDANGKFIGLRVDTVADLGGYLSLLGTAIPTWLYGPLLAGPYTTPAIYCNVKGVFTNTAPTDAVRGAGRPEATYLLERIVDKAARETGIDQAELRKRNMIANNAYPYQTPVVHVYDSGDYGASLDKAADLADIAGLGGRRAESEKTGKLRGVGISSYIEACGIAPSAAAGAIGGGVGGWESAQVRFNPTGSVEVFTGSHAHGQGHDTTFAQIVSDRLGVPIENVEIIHGDTQRHQFGMGTYGSRSLVVGGTAIVKAMDKIVDKGKKIAAHLMEASEDDIEFDGGNYTVAGTDKAVNIAEVAFAAYVPHNYPEGVEPGLDEIAFYDPLNFSFPAGTHVCEVEVDPDTGEVEIVNYVAVDDFGTLINPLIVGGQVHGGIVHGVGQAMLEHTVYDDEGQLASGSFMDYAMPRADDVPSFNIDYTKTESPMNPLGAKGCGEAGAIASPPALINAIVDALAPLGVTNVDMPATPSRVWQAIQSARAAAE
jgi:carbon-monoxide dehydrogenase large subunit